MTIRVAVWGPGSMGVIALRGVIDHPELELVDLVVHSDVKAGRDAGQLCGADPVGVVETTDPARLLDGDADVVVYAAAANLRPLEAVNDMVSILRAGKNVVSCSVVPLVYPHAVDATFTEPLREAALAGGVSFFTTGIDSGFANDVLPLALSGVAHTIDSIRVTEMFNYATYPDRTAYDILGFGKPPEELPFAATPGVFTFGWGPVLHRRRPRGSLRRHRRNRRACACPNVVRYPDGPRLSRNDRGHEVHLDGVCRGQFDLCHRPRQPHARRHRTRLAAATHFDPAA